MAQIYYFIFYYNSLLKRIVCYDVETYLANQYAYEKDLRAYNPDISVSYTLMYDNKSSNNTIFQ